ncbi:MAG: hypothetical protein E7641_05170 [Ruminococcaceae bacterium]|nr:hypothetical protein [Oscillospiraceae bacterium]
MKKNNYFDTLDILAANVKTAVKLAIQGSDDTLGELSELHKRSYTLTSSLDRLLFEDYLPPLERDNIAAYAHALVRVIDLASDKAALSRPNRQKNVTDEEALCIELATQIKENTEMLRRLKKPADIPDIRKFRELLHKCRVYHSNELVSVASGRTPRALSEAILSVGRLRLELSCCFDKLLEIMLNNI